MKVTDNITLQSTRTKHMRKWEETRKEVGEIKKIESKSVASLSTTNEHQEHWHVRNRTESIQKLRTVRFLLLFNHFVSYLYATSMCWCRPGTLSVPAVPLR